ncbi:hypothetical protein [Croceiramulus getboli]
MSKVSVAQDERGCLIVKAPLVSTDPVVTNDLVELLSYKKFIWLGRTDNVINSGGIKLHPEQIEAKMARHIDVPFFVAGKADDSTGERLVIILETEEPEVVEQLKAQLVVKKNFPELSRYQIPKEVYAIHHFERTDNGKLKRGATLRKIIDQEVSES